VDSLSDARMLDSKHVALGARRSWKARNAFRVSPLNVPGVVQKECISSRRRCKRGLDEVEMEQTVTSVVVE
jgi:hypothetical protein